MRSADVPATEALPWLPPQIETERLVLRPYREGDGPAYYEVCVRNREHLFPFEAGNPALAVTSVEQAEALVRQFAADWEARRAFFFGAWEKRDLSFAAQIYVGVVDRDLPEFEIGYFADVAHEGQGFVTEAVRAALRFAFDCLGAHRVSLRCNDTNARSYRVAERCGFTLEGHARQTNRHVRLDDGTCTGELFYGMLREEYEKTRLLR